MTCVSGSTFQEQLPPLYRPWFRAWGLELGEVRETRVECGSCRTGAARRGFQPDLKCCTFFPFVPNYLVGQVLADPLAAATMRSVLADPEQGSGAIPLGLLPSSSYQGLARSRGQKAFGLDEELLCPFFRRPAGACAIWTARPAPCVSYFCESSYGESGARFWRECDDFLTLLEMALAQRALLEAGLTWPEVARLLEVFPKMGEQGVERICALSRDVQNRLWLEFAAPEERLALYVRCFEFVRSRGSEEVGDLLGKDGRARLDRLRDMAASMTALAGAEATSPRF